MASLFRRLLPKPVANTGSQLRDHQANERTFLSWTRMGLAFAAMGLAVGRLGLIEHLFSPDVGIISKSRDKTDTAPGPLRLKTSPDVLASRMCQVISVWSFGYGLSRYVSVRRNLAKNQFVPAIWGPVLMTVGTLGVIGVLIQMDWKRPAPARKNDRVNFFESRSAEV
ncbi:hypothetical protein BJX76DRAFT_357623 [Aspergillus varians]